MTKKSVITIQVDEDIKNTLLKRAEKEKRSLSNYVLLLLEDHLNDK